MMRPPVRRITACAAWLVKMVVFRLVPMRKSMSAAVIVPGTLPPQARGVDQNVQPAEPGHRGIHHRVDRSGVAGIALQPGRAGAVIGLGLVIGWPPPGPRRRTVRTAAAPSPVGPSHDGPAAVQRTRHRDAAIAVGRVRAWLTMTVTVGLPATGVNRQPRANPARNALRQCDYARSADAGVDGDRPGQDRSPRGSRPGPGGGRRAGEDEGVRHLRVGFAVHRDGRAAAAHRPDATRPRTGRRGRRGRPGRHRHQGGRPCRHQSDGRTARCHRQRRRERALADYLLVENAVRGPAWR